MRQVLNISVDARNFDGILVILAPQAMTHPMPVAESLVAAMKGHQYPFCLLDGREKRWKGCGLPERIGDSYF